MMQTLESQRLLFRLIAIARTADLRGALKVDSAPGQGFSATLVMPGFPRAWTAEWTRRCAT
jgi:hypothetical protein